MLSMLRAKYKQNLMATNFFLMYIFL